MSRWHQRKQQLLPAWYYRVNVLTPLDPYTKFNPEHFDEDISDLESSKDGSVNDVPGRAQCDCDDENDDCEHQAEDDEDVYDSDDNTSERSYNGIDADWYYELKELREDRKRELQKMAEEKADEKDFESRKAEEVRAAYKAMKQAEKESETLHMGSLNRKTFRLYSPDHVDHFWTRLPSSKFISFYYPNILDYVVNGKGFKKYRRYIEGRIHLDTETEYHFQAIRAPTRPSRKKKVLQLNDDKGTLVVKFVSDEHIIVRVSRARDLVFGGHPRSKPKSAPEVFEFMGILHDREKEEEEEEERLERLRKRRGPSPRETWFERAHPMGHWNQCF